MSSQPQPLESNIRQYSLLRKEKYYLGRFLISTTSLEVDPALHRPFNAAHAANIKPMYSKGLDNRSADPLECVVRLKDKEKVDEWVKEQDPSKFKQSQPGEMLILHIPDCSFPIIKGQHRYRAYLEVLEENGLP